MFVVEHHAEAAIGQDLVDLPLEGEEFFFCQCPPFMDFGCAAGTVEGSAAVAETA
jgi:hypothetical protein